MKRRRGNKEGAIYQRGDGWWCASFTYGYTETGKRRRRVVYGRTKQEAQDKLLRLQSDSLAGLSTEPTSATLAEFLKSWLENTAKPALRPTTYRTWDWHIRKRILPRIGGMKLAKIRPDQIQGFYAQLLREGFSAYACKHAHTILNRAFRDAVQWNFLPRNPCAAVKKPKVQAKVMKCLSKEEAQRLLDTARAARLYALYALAVTTGLRMGELLGLEWDDIDLEAATLSVRRNLVEIAGEFSVGEPKSAKGKRLVTLPEVAVKSLREHRRRMLAEGHIGKMVFCDTDGGYIRQSNLTRRSFKPLLKKAELPDIRFHDLRHTAATLLLQQGVHPKIVQERLGHSQIAVTLDTYSHVLPSMQKEAASQLDALFREQNSEDWLHSGYTEGENGSRVKEAKAQKPSKIKRLNWRARRDSNSRPLASEANALSS